MLIEIILTLLGVLVVFAAGVALLLAYLGRKNKVQTEGERDEIQANGQTIYDPSRPVHTFDFPPRYPGDTEIDGAYPSTWD